MSGFEEIEQNTAIKNVVIKQGAVLHRDDFGLLCHDRKLTTAVEIGTHQALFAETLLRKSEGLSLFCVDPYEGWEVPHTTFYPNDTVYDTRDKDLEHALLKLAPFGERAKILRKTSKQAVSEFADDSIGFVYIDGLHDFVSVSTDLFLWYPKVAKGGVIAGHDFYTNIDPPGVVPAVKLFAHVFDLVVHLTQDTPYSWYCFKE